MGRRSDIFNINKIANLVRVPITINNPSKTKDLKYKVKSKQIKIDNMNLS